MIQEWNLVETNQYRLLHAQPEVAVLPVGAIEAHNLHLPEGQDFLHTSHVAAAACKRAWEKCKSILCLPTIPYGVDCNLMDFKFTIHVTQSTLDALLKDIIYSLKAHGIAKIVLINGHGGNDFVPLMRQLQCDAGVHIFLCDWWRVGADKYQEIFEKEDDHAGEFETSVALALYPDLVEMEHAGTGIPRPFALTALKKGWVKTSRRFSRVNEYCASGDPGRASADKGHRYLELVVTRISDFLVELAEAPADALFPHLPE